MEVNLRYSVSAEHTLSFICAETEMCACENAQSEDSLTHREQLWFGKTGWSFEKEN